MFKGIDVCADAADNISLLQTPRKVTLITASAHPLHTEKQREGVRGKAGVCVCDRERETEAERSLDGRADSESVSSWCRHGVVMVFLTEVF